MEQKWVFCKSKRIALMCQVYDCWKPMTKRHNSSRQKAGLARQSLVLECTLKFGRHACHPGIHWANLILFLAIMLCEQLTSSINVVCSWFCESEFAFKIFYSVGRTFICLRHLLEMRLRTVMVGGRLGELFTWYRICIQLASRCTRRRAVDRQFLKIVDPLLNESLPSGR